MIRSCAGFTSVDITNILNNMNSDSPQIGRHVVADFSGVCEDKLRDDGRIMGVLRGALDRAGFRRLEETVHRFSSGGAGFTAVVLLAESHASVHTYPERGYMALDVFGCGPTDPIPVVEALKRELHPQLVDVQEITRGAGQRDPAPTRAGG